MKYDDNLEFLNEVDDNNLIHKTNFELINIIESIFNLYKIKILDIQFNWSSEGGISAITTWESQNVNKNNSRS